MTRFWIGFGVVVALSGGLIFQSVRVERLKVELADSRERVRVLEEAREAALEDAQRQADACTARVAEARRSARAINSLLSQEVAHDEAGCPDPRVLRGSELRATLQPDAPAP